MNQQDKTGDKILSFGELLLRIMPDTGGHWLAENQLSCFIGGAELNVASALALWGLPSAYFTVLPCNGLSEQITEHLNNKGIDLSRVIYQGNRIGLYFLQQGQDLKYSGTIYDRTNSAFGNLRPEEINWDDVLNDVNWLHISAISPALSQDLANICLKALQVAKCKNIKISIDLNYRPKLWQYGKSPAEIMPQLAAYADLLMGNVWAFNTMLDIPLTPCFDTNGKKVSYLNEAQAVSEKLIARYSKCQAVANTFRFDDLEGLNYYSTLFTNGKLYVSKEYEGKVIVDKVGSGDCYMAGLIYGFYKKLKPQELLEFATAAAYTKLFVKGDLTNKDIHEINKTIKDEK